MVGVSAGDVPQCLCEAHEQLKLLNDSGTGESELEDIKTLIRTPPALTSDSGTNFIHALLR